LHENCNGCIIYEFVESKNLRCGLSVKNFNGECPCSECVVKMMCSEECVDFKWFAKRLK